MWSEEIWNQIYENNSYFLKPQLNNRNWKRIAKVSPAKLCLIVWKLNLLSWKSDLKTTWVEHQWHAGKEFSRVFFFNQIVKVLFRT